MADTRTGSADVLSELRRVRPAKVRAYLSDGETRDVAVPTRRKRWDAVAGVLAALDWTKVEFLDAKGSILGVLETDEAPTPVDTKVTAARDDREGRILELLVKAQQMALAEQRQSMGALLEGYASLAGMMSERLFALERHYGDTLSLLQKAALKVAGPEAAEQPSMQDQLMMGVMMQAVQKLQGGTPKNGHAKPNGAGASGSPPGDASAPSASPSG